MKRINLFKIGVIALLFMMTFAMVLAEDNVNDEELVVTLLNQDPDPAISGEYVELRFQVEKPDTPLLEDISFELMEEYPIVFDSLDTPIKVISSWAGYGDSVNSEHYVLYYKVRVDSNAIKDNFKIYLRYNYTKGYKKISFTKEFVLRVGDESNANLVIGSVISDPIKLMPDSTENEISIEIMNLGYKKAENVMVELKLPTGFSNSYSYSNVDSLGNIDGSSNKDALLYVDLDDSIKEGIYEAQLVVKYKDVGDNTYKQLILPFSFDVKEKPVFELNNNEFVFSAGQSVDLKFDLLNIGSKKAESISVRAFKDSTQPFEFDEKSDFIGTLDANESGMAVLKMTINQDATPKKYMLDVQIRSIKNGQVFLQEEVVPIVIEESQGNNSVVKYIIGLIFLVLVILGSYFYGKSQA